MEVLFDPFEEQFHLPATFVKRCDRLGGLIEIVRQKHYAVVVFRVVKFNSPEFENVQTKVNRRRIESEADLIPL